jgi:beta-glucanase (GH16 family)
MRLAAVFAVMVFALYPGLARSADPSTNEYRLVWADEFEEVGEPNPEHWTYERGFVRNRESQWYQPENAVCKDGLLIIVGRRERKPNPNYDKGSKDWKKSRKRIEYTSSCLLTKGLHSWKYGRFEIRARIKAQDAKGVSPPNSSSSLVLFEKKRVNQAANPTRDWTPRSLKCRLEPFHLEALCR